MSKAKPFCVIAPVLRDRSRYWFATEQEAIDHATKIMTNKQKFVNRYGRPEQTAEQFAHSDTLMICKAVKVVTPKEPIVPVTIRGVLASDTPE